MDTGKPSNTDASSQESDNQPEKEKEKSKDDTTGVGRSYECIFCKRGFTNAQALGGHMNIHRKDKAKAKAKAKQKINQEETSNKSNLRYMSQVSTTHVHDHRQPLGFQRVVGGQMNYQVYLPSQNPNFQTGNCLPLWQSDRLEGGVTANLSLRMGISTANDKDGEGGDVDSNVKENDVDLELRLGQQP